MKRFRAFGVRSVLAGVFLFFAFPAFASAAVTDVTSRTAQLLPPGGTSCAPVTVSSVTSYIYDGSLDSFDVIIPDSSYVVIGGSAGDHVIPFQFSTRRITPNGQLLIHTDLDPTPTTHSMPVSITLLSPKNGVLCASTISFTVQGTTSNPSIPISQPVQQGPSQSTSNPPASTGQHSGGVATTAPATTTSTSSLGICSVQSGALKLWLALLVLYAAVVAFAALAQPAASARNPAIPVTLILVPLILLVGFWYFSPECRAANWVPIALLIIAVAGLLAAFREKEGSVLLLPGMERPLTPPSTKHSVPATTTPAPKPMINPEPQQAAPKNAHVENIQKKFEEAKQQHDKQQEQ